MVVQKAITALALLAFNVVMLSLAVALPAAHSRGDVGTAFLPMAVAVAGMILAAVYLVGARHGVGRSAGGAGRSVWIEANALLGAKPFEASE